MTVSSHDHETGNTMTTPNLPHSCGGCANRWAGNNTCHCGSRCHQTFSSPRAFDSHRIGRGTREGQCADPAEVGLIQLQRTGYEVWGYPADEEAVARLRAVRAGKSAEVTP